MGDEGQEKRSHYTQSRDSIRREKLDSLEIRLADPVPDSSKYITSYELVNLNIQEIEIVQIKTGKAKPRTPRMYMQADTEALLLMETLKLKNHYLTRGSLQIKM